MLVVYDSRFGNGKAFAEKLGMTTQSVSEELNQECVLVTRNEGLGEISQATREFLDNAFKSEELKTVGTGINELMPPVSRFGNSNREEKKNRITDKLRAFFDKYSGLGIGSELKHKEHHED